MTGYTTKNDSDIRSNDGAFVTQFPSICLGACLNTIYNFSCTNSGIYGVSIVSTNSFTHYFFRVSVDNLYYSAFLYSMGY